MSHIIMLNVLTVIVVYLQSLSVLAGALPKNRHEFFDSQKMYYVRIKGWDQTRLSPEALRDWTSTYQAWVDVFQTDAQSHDHCPDQEAQETSRIFSTQLFDMRMTGNFTFGTPKASYKLRFYNKDQRLLGMKSLNMKAMWNDVSQMREALSWRVFREAGVVGSGHSYAKVCINGRYLGLYSLIEEVDGGFLKDRFGANSKGNLYKAYWAPNDVGPATLEYRKDSQGRDGGSAYFRQSDLDQRTYRLKTNDEPNETEFQTYDDLATWIRTLHSLDPSSKDFAAQMKSVMDVKGFLKWAAANMLLGGWDNYWKTPANYYVYNSGPAGSPNGFLAKPFFRWIPWDYDSSLGLRADHTEIWYSDIVDWGRMGSHHLALIQRLLKNEDFLKFYLDEIEGDLDRFFNPAWFEKRMDELWNHIQTAVYLESDSEFGWPHTGRQFSNNLCYWRGRQNEYLEQGSLKIMGILHHVKMRHGSAREQLAQWRKTYPKGAGQIDFQ